MLTRLIGVVVLTVLGLASSAAAERPELFAQANLQQSLDCPPPGITPFADTGLFVTFETKAHAVLVSVALQAEFPANSGLQARPTIDGVGFNIDPQLTYLGGTLDSHRPFLSFSRAYAVSPGVHTYGLEWGCFGRPNVFDGWITVVPIR
jgi:hypothetical protein